MLRYESHHLFPRQNDDVPRVQQCMRRTAWIWLVGCVAWAADGVINAAKHDVPHAELALLVALLFGIAWLFYRNTGR